MRKKFKFFCIIRIVTILWYYIILVEHISRFIFTENSYFTDYLLIISFFLRNFVAFLNYIYTNV